MSTDMRCPYCGSGEEVCHDDGAGYAEDVLHEHTCSECEKTFVFTTATIHYYHPAKADCLNGSPHDLSLTKTYPREFSRMKCSGCDYERRATLEELAPPPEPQP